MRTGSISIVCLVAIFAGLTPISPWAARLDAGEPEIPTVKSRSSIPLNGLPIIKMTADFARPYIYAVEEEGVTARVLVINTETEVIERVLSVGSNVTDLDVHYPEARLYLNNYLRPETQRVNLRTLSLTSPLFIDDKIGRVEAGRYGRLYVRVYGYYGYEYWVIDTATGAQVGEIPDYRDFEDSEADPTGLTMVLGDAGDSGAALHKYDISTDDPVRIRSSRSNPYGSETILMCGDGSRFFWNKTVYDSNLVELNEHQDEIFAATFRGHLVFSSSRAYDGFTGGVAAYLPTVTSKMAVSGDQQKLFLWDAAADAILVVPISAIAGVPPLVPDPTPVDGATIASPLMELSWSAMPHAQAYDVYLGDSASLVANATTTSSSYQGRVTDPRRVFDPPRELPLGTIHFWRVDVVSGGQPIPGPVWSFTTSPMRVSPSRVEVSGITGTPVADVVLSLSGPGVGWIAAVDQPWLDLSSTGGATPSQVSVSFDTTGLPSGIHTALIDIVADGVAFSVPVRLDLLHLRPVAMVADRVRPYLYVLHDNGDLSNNSYLAFVRADTLELVKLIPIGAGATDLSINTFEGRLYINNSARPRVRVVDLTTQTEIGPLDVDTGVAEINAGRAGRIYIRTGGSWPDINVVNSQTGAVINTFPGFDFDGVGEVDPTGNFYYHGHGTVLKFDISTDNPLLITESPFSWNPSLPRTIVLSADGRRILFSGHLFDADLAEIADFGVVGHSMDTGGRRFATNGFVVDAASGDIVTALPAASTVTAFSVDDERIFVTDEVTGSIMDLELPDLPLFADGFEWGSTVRWSLTITGG